MSTSPSRSVYGCYLVIKAGNGAFLPCWIHVYGMWEVALVRSRWLYGGGMVSDGWGEVGGEGVPMVLDMCDLTEFFFFPGQVTLQRGEKCGYLEMETNMLRTTRVSNTPLYSTHLTPHLT